MDRPRYRKKLIEVALPLEAINKASAKEKSIRHGHPSTLHLWWARRPLAAARAVIFAQMVDDPSANPELFPTERRQERERQRLFQIIEELVRWENTNNENVLEAARAEIWQSWRRACADNAGDPRAKALFDRKNLPSFHDPFAGGGALPLEAQRLGLVSHASDLNPVAVLINMSMIQIPAAFAGKPPVNEGARRSSDLIAHEWKGAQGLAEDVRYYGKWLRDEAERRVGNLYPKIHVTPAMAASRTELRQYVGKELPVIAWLWARTVKSPNPAFREVDVPLASTFLLSVKEGKSTLAEPVIGQHGYRFEVKKGTPEEIEKARPGTKLSRGSNFSCLMSGVPISAEYIKTEGQAGRIGARMMAIVAEGDRERIYLSPASEHEQAARQAHPFWKSESELPHDPRNFWTVEYGLARYGDLFTNRQLAALTTFSALVEEARGRALEDGLKAGLAADDRPLSAGGTGARGRADAIAVYLAFSVSKAADRNSSLCFWESPMDRLRGTFGRQSVPMVWDYAETNPFAGAGGDIYGTTKSLCEVLDTFLGGQPGFAQQADAGQQTLSQDRVISTDPPYYDNIGYADLSDFFYVWLRRSIQHVLPDLFATVLVPKSQELVASPYRHGGKEKAEEFFLDGMTAAMRQLGEQAHPAFPVTIYYAFKQAEARGAGDAVSTGWETFLDAVIRSGFAISGTWPMRTELTVALKKRIGALASSIVLVCRTRSKGAPTATRREFVMALKTELPPAIAHLQRGNIAPVDLAQAALGPGMEVFSRYSAVLDAEGRAVTVREALALINETLGEALAEQEGDFDTDSRWALTWFEQSGFEEGDYGAAEQLSKAKNTSVQGMVQAGIIESRRGVVRLLRPEELASEWDPESDDRLTAWEMVHHLIRNLGSKGESAAAALVAKLGARAEVARELAYRLYALCERKKRPSEALSYNGLVQSWPELARLARGEGKTEAESGELFGKDVE